MNAQESQQKLSVIEVKTVPIGFVPTPTREFMVEQRRRRSAGASIPLPIPIPPRIPIPIPIPWPLLGPRVLMWKQDPSVTEIGIRKAWLPSYASNGPKDTRIEVKGLPLVNKNASGDFIETPGTESFDSVHAFAIVRQTLTMYQRALDGKNIKWQWNTATNTDTISVYPHAGVTMNAYYSRNQKALKFFYFDKPGAPPPAPKIFTCRSLDIVSHETGHAILDGLKPNWLDSAHPAQTGGLHESFGDLTAIFLALSQMDQVEAMIALTKANLHDKNFLADLAEEFGSALGRPNGLRNADNNLKLSQVTSEVHDISQVFTGGIYDVLADIFVFERNYSKEDPACTLYSVGQYMCGLVLRAFMAAPKKAATYADVVNQMLKISNADGKPVQYRNFIRNRFTYREVVVSPTPLTEDYKADLKLAAHKHAHLMVEGRQDRSGCCGTMRLPEYNGRDELINAEIDELKKAFGG